MVRPKHHITLLILLMALFFAACQSDSKQLEKAWALYQQGLELSSENSVAAAETYSEALLVLDRCLQNYPEVHRLKGLIENQLGTRYWRNGLKEEALALHQDAIAIFRSLSDTVALMDALQNAGRVAASLHQVDEAGQYYEEALQIAQNQNNKQFAADLLLELGRDVYMYIPYK